MSPDCAFPTGGRHREREQWNGWRGFLLKRRGKRALSPCIDVCRLDPESGWCLGCGRTADEIRAWAKLSPFRRNRLHKELDRRLVRLGQQALEGD